MFLFAPKKPTKLTNKTAAISFEETIKPSLVLDIPKTFFNVERFTVTNPVINSPKINKAYTIKFARLKVQLGVFRILQASITKLFESKTFDRFLNMTLR